jgi:hypothetical protein
VGLKLDDSKIVAKDLHFPGNGNFLLFLPDSKAEKNCDAKFLTNVET